MIIQARNGWLNNMMRMAGKEKFSLRDYTKMLLAIIPSGHYKSLVTTNPLISLWENGKIILKKFFYTEYISVSMLKIHENM